MGMDLIPHNSGHPGLSYNWSGWKWLKEHLHQWGVDISELKGLNDGDSISPKTCRAISYALLVHSPELSEEDQKWLRGELEGDKQNHIMLWRTMKGCDQY